MSTPVLNPKITKAGLALLPNGSATGFVVTLTHIAIGTALYVPTSDDFSLRAEVARYAISSGSNPTPTSIQVGTTITDTDPQGRSPNGLAIGEIGFYAGSVLFAIWSQSTTPLFVKSASFDVPFAYTLDVSVLPVGSVIVTTTTDPAGMAALILQHEAKADPHPKYVLKARGMGEYDPLTTYGVGAKVTASDNKTYRGLVASNVGNSPQINPTKWERWGHSVAEMDAEFVPRRTGTQVGGSTVIGMVRVTNPETAYYSVSNASVIGAFKITFPTAAYDSFFRMRVELFDATVGRSITLLVSAYVTAGLAWSNASVSILGQKADRDVNVRLGNDGTKPCIWIGELTSAWANPRVYVSELMISANADGGTVTRWNTGWTIAPTTLFGAVSSVIAGNLVFGQSDIAHVAGLQSALDAKLALTGGNINGTLGIINSNSLMFGATNGYTAFMCADASGIVGLINQARTGWNVQVTDAGVVSFPRARPNWAGLNPWDNGNLPNPAQTTGAAFTGPVSHTSSVQMLNGNPIQLWAGGNGYYANIRGDAGGYSGFLNQAQSAWNLTVTDGGVVSFPRARPNWAGLTPWDTGNFNPANYAPNRNGGNANAGYVGTNTGQSLIMNWDGNFRMYVDGTIGAALWGTHNFDPNNAVNLANNANANANGRVPMRNGNLGNGYVIANQNSIQIGWDGANYPLYTDNQFQGYILHTGTYQNWAAPRSVMDYGGVGSYTYMNTGGNPGANTLVNLPGLGGTWRCMSAGFGTQGKDYLYVRIG